MVCVRERERERASERARERERDCVLVSLSHTVKLDPLSQLFECEEPVCGCSSHVQGHRKPTVSAVSETVCSGC